jgi:hypothetical protein
MGEFPFFVFPFRFLTNGVGHEDHPAFRDVHRGFTTASKERRGRRCQRRRTLDPERRSKLVPTGRSCILILHSSAGLPVTNNYPLCRA